LGSREPKMGNGELEGMLALAPTLRSQPGFS
jgi:hypothetical protein